MTIKIGFYLPKNQNSDRHKPYIQRLNKMPSGAIEELLELVRNDQRFEVVEVASLNDALIMNGDVLYHGVNLGELDIFFWYGEIRNPSDISGKSGSYTLDLLKTLSRTIKVIPNPNLFETCLDKYTAHSVLKQNGVQVSDFILINKHNLSSVEPVLDQWHYALLKPRKGAFGKGVTLIQTFSELRDILEFMEQEGGVALNEGILLEKYYPNDPEQWVSVTLINGEIMYAYKKQSSRFCGLGNLSQAGKFRKVYDANEVGGAVEIGELTSQHQELAYSSHDALPYEMISFDMIWHQDHPIVVDENTFPGLYPKLFELQNISLAHSIYELILRAVGEA